LDTGKVTALQRSLKKKIHCYALAELIKHSDLIIEAAGAKVVPGVVDGAIACGKDVMIMSAGGLLMHPRLLAKAQVRGIRLFVPSGAIAGLDALKAAKIGTIYSVTLTTTKPIKGLAGAPYIAAHNINLNTIKKERVIFKGSARKAVAAFPQNINVAAILSLAGIGPEKTEVCIVASRRVKRNIHTIEIKGDFGTIRSCAENVPSEINPKTSALAMLSAVAMLEGMIDSRHIGT
jgi:aspartate dehydrogenase